MTAKGKTSGGTGTMLALALVAALGSMAIHMLVPALPMLAHDFDTDPQGARAAISVYMIGLGTAQLVAGPAVDRIGRAPVMLAGLALYMLGALGCVMAGSLPVLLIARAVQAAGGAAGVVTTRVMVADLFGREEAAARQATLMTIVLISPALAPVVGGVLASSLGWRMIPAALGVIALGVFLIMLRRLPKTQATGSQRSLIRDYARLVRNPRLTLTTVALATASCTLYMFLAGAPFLLHDEGLDAKAIGIALLCIALTAIAGTRMVRFLAKGGRGLEIGVTLIFTGALIEAVVAALGGHQPLALIAPMLLVGMGSGITGPSAMAIILFADEELAGTATSLAGATQMLASALATLLLGLITPLTPFRLALALVASGTLCLLAGWRGGRVARQERMRS